MDSSRSSHENTMEYLVNLGKKDNVLEVSNDLFYTLYGSNDDLADYVTDNVLYEDMALAAGAVIIILVLIICNTGSLFLTLAAMSQIMLSFPVATFFLNTILRIDYFPFLNFIVVCHLWHRCGRLFRLSLEMGPSECQIKTQFTGEGS